LAEEKRLLYVAVTRARDELYLVGYTRSNTKNTINSWWDWLRHHVGLNEATGDGVARLADEGRSLDLPVTASLEAIGAPPPDEEGPPPLYDSLDDAPAGDVEETVARTREEMKFRDESRLFPRFRVTDLVEYARCPARFYLLRAAGIPESMLRPATVGAGRGQSDARLIGTLAHAALERLEDLDAVTGKALRQRLEVLARQIEDAGPAGEDVIREAAGIVTRFRATSLFGDLRAAENRHAELPFILHLKSGVLDGVMDVVYRCNGRWRVVDYKTTHVAARDRTKRMEEMRAHYRPQIEVYALAAARMFETDAVDAALYLTDIGEEIAFSYATDDLKRVEVALNKTVRKMAGESPAGFPPGRNADCKSCAYAENRLCAAGKGPLVDARRRSVHPN